MALSLKCLANLDLGNGQNRIVLRAILPLDAAPEPAPEQTPKSPRKKPRTRGSATERQVGMLVLQLPAADAAQFVKGNSYSIAN